MLTIHEKPIVAPPAKRLVTVTEAAEWHGQAWRKMDGIFATATFRAPSGGGKGGMIADLQVEIMQKRSGGLYTPSDLDRFARFGVWYAICDVLAVDGLDIKAEPTRRRWHYSRQLATLLRASDGVFLADFGSGGGFAEKCLADGGEGAVWKDPDAPYGQMVAVKRGGIWTCRVSSIGSTQAVGIMDAETGQDRGRVKMGGGKCDQVRIGSIIRVEGLGLTDLGKIRERRACREWLVKL